MSKVTKFIKAETRTSKSTGKEYVINTILVDDKLAECFGTVKEGDEGELTYSEKYKKWEFKPAGKNFAGKSGKTFKADPDKLHQDKVLEIAKNLSIQRQKSADLAVQLVINDKRDNLQDAFDELMSLISPSAKKHDHLPTEKEVDDLDLDVELG